jgi:hypothetical protein
MVTNNHKTAPTASTHTASAPAVSKTTKRKGKPSVITSLLAATVTDNTPPVSQIPAAAVVPLTSTTSVTAPVLPTQPIPTASGTVPAATSPPLPAALNAPPDVVFPTPDGFQAPIARDFSGYRPTERLILAATTAINDLGNVDDYVAVFGSAVPAASKVAGAIALGIQWRDMRDLTETWDAYVRAQDALAWKAALLLLDELKPVFLNAIAKNGALASQYPGLTQLFQAPREYAKQAAATKAKKAKAKAATTGTTAVATSASPAATATEAPAAPPRTVTVTG